MSFVQMRILEKHVLRRSLPVSRNWNLKTDILLLLLDSNGCDEEGSVLSGISDVEEEL